MNMKIVNYLVLSLRGNSKIDFFFFSMWVDTHLSF